MSHYLPEYVSASQPLVQIKYFLRPFRLLGLLDYLLRDTLLRWVFEFISKFRPDSAQFSFSGRLYPYCSAPYNRAWSNERSLEIPIAQAFIKPFHPQNLLEIGHTLGHYQLHPWTVVDKFETAPGVINRDILLYKPVKRFNALFSLSTFEHIGIDDHPRELGKVISALKAIRRFLIPKGQALITFPAGYNQVLDQYAFKFFTRLLTYRRTSPINLWVPVSPRAIRHARYGWPYNNGNILVIGQIL